MGSATYKNGGGAQVTTDKYTVYTVLYTRAAPGFWFEGEHRKNFIHEFLSSPVLQWRVQNFGWGGGTISTNVLIKDFLKIF